MIKERVLIISGIQIFPPMSGGQIRTAAISNALLTLGTDVTIYSFTGRKHDYLKRRKSFTTSHKGIEEYVNLNPIFGFLQFLSYKLSLPPFWQYIFTYFFSLKKLNNLIKESSIVITDFPFIRIKDNFPKKMFLNTHNIESDLWNNSLLKKLVRSIEKTEMKRSSKIFFCTDSDMNRAINEFSISHNKSVVVPNGVCLPSSENFSKNTFKKELGISEEETVIVFSGSKYGPNIDAFKFLSSFVQTNQKRLEELKIMFLVCGTVSDLAYKENQIIVTSFVENIFPYLMCADIAINPTTIGSGSNIKMFEYVELQLPIITTKFGTIGLKLTNDESCIIFKRDNLMQTLENIKSMNLSELAKCAKNNNSINREVVKKLKEILTGKF